eukprot:gene26313-31786_t
MISGGPVSVGIVMFEPTSSNLPSAFVASSSGVFDRVAGKTSLLLRSMQTANTSSSKVLEGRSSTSSHSQVKSHPTALDVCSSVIERRARSSDSDVLDHERWSNEKVADYVQGQVLKWSKVLPVNPEHFLQRILQCRGYDTNYIKTCPRDEERLPSEQQIKDYDNDIVWAIRNSDLAKLQELHANGRSMTACNRYSESIVHMACRRSEKEIVQFLLQNGADFSVVDDYGRTALHDACWRPEPRFDIVVLIMDAHLDLVRHIDARGATPLKYVREEHWLQWCAFLFNQIEKYWAPRPCPDAQHPDEPCCKRCRTE